MTLALFPLVMLAVMLNASAQLLLKGGVLRLGHIDFSLNNLVSLGLQLGTNPFILLGLAFYVISVAVWIMVLSRVDVSIAYPMVSLGYVVNAIAAMYLFGEHVSIMRMTGIFVILTGVYMVARS